MAVDTLPTLPDLSDPSTLEARFNALIAVINDWNASVETTGALISGGLPSITDFSNLPDIADRANFASDVNWFLFYLPQWYASLVAFAAAVPGLSHTFPAEPVVTTRSAFNTNMQALLDDLPVFGAKLDALVP